MQARHGPAGISHQRVPDRRHDRGDPLHARGGRRQPLRQRGELTGQEREQARPEQVDPGVGVPAVLPKLRLVEAMGRDLRAQEIPVDLLVRGQPAVGHGGQVAVPTVEEGESPATSGLGQVGPASVMDVEAGLGRPEWVDGEVLVEEGIDALGEFGHRQTVAEITPDPCRHSTGGSGPRV